MSKSTDVPALSGAAVAGSVSIFMGSGSYGVVSVITGLALMFFLLTYSWSAADSTSKRLVFSMVFSLVSLPLIAFFIEGYMYFIDGCHSVLNVHCLDGFGWVWMGLDGFGWVWMGLDGFGWVWKGR